MVPGHIPNNRPQGKSTTFDIDAKTRPVSAVQLPPMSGAPIRATPTIATWFAVIEFGEERFPMAGRKLKKVRTATDVRAACSLSQ